MRPVAYLLSLPVRGYRLLFSPWVGHSCRFQPTCSVYALEALERHGALKGGALAVWRVLRCNPWGGFGYDPVPGADPAFDAERAKARAARKTGKADQNGKEPPDAR